MKRFVSLIVILAMLVCMVPSSFADNTSKTTNSYKTTVVSFSEFQFVADGYDPEMVQVKYSKKGNKEIAILIDRNSGAVLETMAAEAVPSRMPNVYPYIFTRSVSYGKTTVTLSINVEIYSSGSFRQINSYQGGYLGITSSITNTYLEGSNFNVWSPSGFPTTELYYTFNGTITAEVTVSGSTEGNIQIGDQLIAAGFNFEGTVGTTLYYRKGFNASGTIKLYN